MKEQRNDELLTVAELSAKIKFSKQAIYNLIYRGEFILNKHYLKPLPKKILFIWTAIEEWMENPSGNPAPNAKASQSNAIKPKSQINI
jgi:hypothetical protein